MLVYLCPSRNPPPSRTAVPNLSGTRDYFYGRQFFLMDLGCDGFRMMKAYYIYCALYFYYYYVSSTSDYQALDPQRWGPLV